MTSRWASYDESLRYMRDDLRLRGLFNRGNAAYMMENYVEAVEAYIEVLRIDPDDLDAKHNLELALRPAAAGQRLSASGRGRDLTTTPERISAAAAG